VNKVEPIKRLVLVPYCRFWVWHSLRHRRPAVNTLIVDQTQINIIGNASGSCLVKQAAVIDALFNRCGGVSQGQGGSAEA
jgi:hypothetical protein